ncbi:MAG: nuclear transport factor 2 family protein [Marinifilaceae bacterium]|jgi:hypothetical protein|nr:nuclear transport factor 2 family protein [Marinifilaceae bacterium]
MRRLKSFLYLSIVLIIAQSCNSNSEIKSKELREIKDRQDITQLLYKNVRSIDRLDLELMKSTYWKDAIQDHQDPINPIDYSGNAHKFCEFAVKALGEVERTHHRLSNLYIEIDGDKAYAEAYVYAYHYYKTDKGNKEGTLLGRYQNKLEKRNGEWKISYRLTIFDANFTVDASDRWNKDFRNLGKRFPEDQSYNINTIK